MATQHSPFALLQKRVHHRRLLAALVLGGLLLPVEASAFPQYFSPVVRESNDLSIFKKWGRVLASHPSDIQQANGMCRGDAGCRALLWDRYVSRMRGLGRRERIIEAHRLFNSSPYITDMVNWGMQDYWETPLEFLLQSGDCEDYAIAKYMLLRAVGVEADAMRIVVLQDTNLNEMHAVLVVDDGGEALVLDNFQRDVVPSRRIFHYRPIYAVNEKQWWRH